MDEEDFQKRHRGIPLQHGSFFAVPRFVSNTIWRRKPSWCHVRRTLAASLQRSNHSSKLTQEDMAQRFSAPNHRPGKPPNKSPNLI
ncbi:hypothetical protein MCOR01_009260 [Pyricularia oryzae]|nr:hypothetical protein MCOR01_009260 [Pyricularia oryzae]